MTFLRYIIIQLLAYCIDLGTFLIALNIGVFGAIFSNLVAKFSAGIFAFIAHRHFTFRVAGNSAKRNQALRYFMLLVINIPASSVIMALILMWLQGPIFAKFIADVISVSLTYLLSKRFIFTLTSQKSGKSSPTGAST